MGRAAILAQGSGQKTSLLHRSEYEPFAHEQRGQFLMGAAGATAAMGQNLVRLAGQRNTWQGELAYQNEMIRFPARAQLERARAEYQAAGAAEGRARNLVDTGTRYSPAEAKAERARQARRAAENEAKGRQARQRDEEAHRRQTEAAFARDPAAQQAIERARMVRGGNPLAVRYPGDPLNAYGGNPPNRTAAERDLALRELREGRTPGAYRLPTGRRDYAGASQAAAGAVEQARRGSGNFVNGAIRSEVGYVRALEEANRKQGEQAAGLRVHEEDILRLKQAQLTTAEKAVALRNAEVNALQSEKQVLAGMEQRQAGAATSIGRMGLAQRAQTRIGLQLIERGMPLHLIPPQLRAGLESIAPQAMRKRYEQAGLGSDLYKDLQKKGWVDQGDLGKTREESAKVEAQVHVELSINQAKFAQDIAKAIATELKDLVKVTEEKTRTELNQHNTGQHIRQANTH